MDNISNPGEIARIDLLLNELEHFSKLDIQPTKFYSELLRRLNHVVGSPVAWVVHASSESKWHVLACEGDEAQLDCCRWLSEQWEKQLQTLPVRIIQRDLDGAWLAVSLRPIGWSCGGIIVRLPPTIPVASDSGLAEIVSAFCEIASSFQLNGPAQRWETLRIPLRLIANDISTSHNQETASRAFVNGVRSLLDADRVSLVRDNLGGGALGKHDFTVLSISNAAKVNTNSPIVQEIVTAVKSIASSENPNEALALLAKQHNMAAAIAIPIARLSDSSVANAARKLESNRQDSLLVQWADADRYHRAVSVIADVVPRLSDAWILNQYTIRVPARIRAFFNRSQSWQARYKQAISLCILFSAIVFFFSRTQLNVRGIGTLQPTTQRFLFAPADGYIETIFVKDGEQVKPDQLIVTINSPSLQLEINRIESEIQLVEEMRSGFDVTINQLQSNDEKSVLLGGQLAGEIKELEKKRESLITQRNLVHKEQERLELRSPIQGTVIAWELESQLENRPVKLGDTLFRIAHVGPNRDQWRIEVPVADWESGYVSSAMELASEKTDPMKVTFALPATPRKTWLGTVIGSGTSLYSYQGSQHLDFYVKLDESIPDPRIGTSAIVSFPCGNSPRWFVWTRAIIDAIHRRFWF